MQRWFSSSALGMTENTSSKNNTQRNNSQQNVVKRRSKQSPPRLPYHKLFTYRPEFVWKQKGNWFMKPIKSSGMPLFLMLLGLTIFTDIITRLNGKPRSATIVTIWAIVSLMLLYPRWCVYYITPEGFQRKYLGLFPMKDISWKEIRDVERTAGRGTTLLLVSTIYVRYPMPDKQTKKALRSC